MRKRQLIEGLLAFVAMISFTAFFLGASMLNNEDKTGWILCGIALLLAVPVVILTNREVKE